MVDFKKLSKLVVCLGLLQISGYYLSGTLASCDGCLLQAPQPDTLLYCQAARRIVEGHPFSFSEGELASTGTTSILYPFVLALPYAIGAKGSSLFMAGFLLNAAFYLTFLFAWTRVFCTLLEKPILRLVSVFLLVASPQPAYCACAQSDIGLWMAVSGLFAAAFVADKKPVYVMLLALGPWIRPEGMVLCVAFCAYAALTKRKGDVLAATIGVASSLGVFLLNMAISGKAQFSSVTAKGHFTTCFFPVAIYRTAFDMLQIVKGFVLGMSDLPPRLFFMIPIFGAVCIAIGVVAHLWRNERGARIGAFLLASFGGLAMVSMSGWQNTNVDRYLAWIVPLVVLFMSEGVVVIGEKISSAYARKCVVFLPIVYAACASIVMFAMFNGNCNDTAMLQEFGRKCESLLPTTASVGGFSCGIAYELSNRRFAHLAGIYSPEFQTHEKLSAIEILKHEQNMRFDYLFSKPNSGFGSNFTSTCSDSVATGPAGWELRQMKWEAFDNAAVIPECGEGLHCVARVDVGYEKDEAAAAYSVESRYERIPFDPILEFGKGSADGRQKIEVARMVAGLDQMTVPLEAGKGAKVVMRTFSSCDVVSHGAFVHTGVKYEILNPARLNLSVNGAIVGEVSYSAATNGFTDVVFDIPASAITSSPSTVAFLGDHIACCYWFYQ